MEEETESVRVVIVDSSIFVDHLREYAPAVSFFRSLIKEKQQKIIYSAITETELIAGKSCENFEVKNRVLQMLNGFQKIEVINRIALTAGDICRRYDVKLPDAIIAATALIYKAELLTKNIEDFKNIEGLKIKVPY